MKRTKEEEEEENAVDAAKPKKEGKKRITPDNQGEDETHKEQKKKSRKVKEEERQQLQQEEEAEYKESSVSRKRKRIPAPEPIPELTATPAFARKVDRIMGFMDGFTDMGADEARLLMRGRLGGSRACRMNVYWGRGAVGLHYRKGKVDFAYFRPSPDPAFGACPEHCLVAAALQAADIVVPCLLFRCPKN